MRTILQITRPAGILEVDFDGSAMQAAIMVVRRRTGVLAA